MVQQQSGQAADTETKDEAPKKPRLTPQVLIMIRSFLASPQRTKILLLATALVAVISATAASQIRLNAWNQPFYDALQRKEINGLQSCLSVKFSTRQASTSLAASRRRSSSCRSFQPP